MAEYKFKDKSKTPIDNFFIGFKMISAQLGYIFGGFLVALGLFSGQFFMILIGVFIIFLSYEINKTLTAEFTAEAAAKAADKEHDNDNDDIGPFSPA